MKRKRILALSAALLLAAASAARSQSPAGDGAQQFASLGECKLQNGQLIRDCRVGYRTVGKLSSDKSNAILWPTWLGSRSEDLLQFVGPGNVVDSGKYFVILVDAFGDGVSSSPSNSKAQSLMRFPGFTIRDMVEAERRLATEVFHLAHVRAVMGISMGGMQTFEWAVRYPEFMDLAIPIAGSPQSTSADKLLWTTAIQAIELDPAWHDGNPTGPLGRGLALAHLIEIMNLTSPDYRVAHTRPDEFDAFVATESNGAKGDGGAAWDHIRQRQAIIDFDIPAELGASFEQAAKRVRAKMLVLVTPQDHMVNPHPAQDFASAIGAPVITLDTPCGHLSLACISAGPVVAQFLADPGSVRSQTLHDRAAR